MNVLWFAVSICVAATLPLLADDGGLSVPGLLAEDTPTSANPVIASIVVDHAVVKPGSSLTAWVMLRHAPGWGTYYKNPGEAGLPTTVTWILPKGVTAGVLEYQVPAIKDFSGMPAYGFKDTSWVRTRINVSPDVPGSLSAIELIAEVQWLVCEKVQCMPGSARIKTKVVLGNENRAASKVADLLKEAGKNFPAPLPKTWNVSLKGKALHLDVPGATPLADGETLFFYPAESGWLTPTFAQEREGWVIKFPEMIGEVPAPLAGILVRSKENWSGKVHGRALFIGGPSS